MDWIEIAVGLAALVGFAAYLLRPVSETERAALERAAAEYKPPSRFTRRAVSISWSVFKAVLIWGGAAVLLIILLHR